jgi:4-amino-4-deoxy-L-arabinose transferase-like glycosyltransferase
LQSSKSPFLELCLLMGRRIEVGICLSRRQGNPVLLLNQLRQNLVVLALAALALACFPWTAKLRQAGHSTLAHSPSCQSHRFALLHIQIRRDPKVLPPIEHTLFFVTESVFYVQVSLLRISPALERYTLPPKDLERTRWASQGHQSHIGLELRLLRIVSKT